MYQIGAKMNKKLCYRKDDRTRRPMGSPKIFGTL